MHQQQKAYHGRDKISFSKNRVWRENKIFVSRFVGDFEPTVFSFFLPSWLSKANLRGNEERVSFFLSHTHHRIVTFRIEILFDFNDTHINTHITQHVRCFL